MIRIKIFKSIGYIAVFWSLVLLASHSRAACNGELELVWESWPPFLYLDSANALTGLDYQLVEAIVANSGCRVSYQPSQTPWKRQLNLLKNGAVDLVSGASRTAERERYAHFSDPYRSESVSLFVRQGESERFALSSLTDLMNSSFGRLGVYRGSYYGEEFERLRNDPEFANKLIVVDDDSQYLELIRINRIDGFLLDSVSGVAFLNRQGALGTLVEQHSLGAIVTGDIHVMFSRKAVNTATVEAFNQSLKQLKQDGRYAQIVKGYLEP